MAARFEERLPDVRMSCDLWWFHPDDKTWLTIEDVQRNDGVTMNHADKTLEPSNKYNHDEEGCVQTVDC